MQALADWGADANARQHHGFHVPAQGKSLQAESQPLHIIKVSCTLGCCCCN